MSAASPAVPGPGLGPLSPPHSARCRPLSYLLLFHGQLLRRLLLRHLLLHRLLLRPKNLTLHNKGPCSPASRPARKGSGESGRLHHSEPCKPARSAKRWTVSEADPAAWHGSQPRRRQESSFHHSHGTMIHRHRQRPVWPCSEPASRRRSARPLQPLPG